MIAESDITDEINMDGPKNAGIIEGRLQVLASLEAFINDKAVALYDPQELDKLIESYKKLPGGDARYGHGLNDAIDVFIKESNA